MALWLKTATGTTFLARTASSPIYTYGWWYVLGQCPWWSSGGGKLNADKMTGYLRNVRVWDAALQYDEDGSGEAYDYCDALTKPPSTTQSNLVLELLRDGVLYPAAKPWLAALLSNGA